jgi:deoxyadenosine/deoxycytidine kinase
MNSLQNQIPTFTMGISFARNILEPRLRQPRKGALIAIEGNVGVGKSTLLTKLRDASAFDSDGIIFLDENIREWQSFVNNDNLSLFELFCDNPKEYAFEFQVLVFLSIIRSLKAVRAQNFSATIVVERSIVTSFKVFATSLAKMNHIGQLIGIRRLEIYSYSSHFLFFDWLGETGFRVLEYMYAAIDCVDCEPDAIVYIESEPQYAFDRIQQRQRRGEEKYSIEYIRLCHELHEEMIAAFVGIEKPVLFLNCQSDLNDNKAAVMEFLLLQKEC